MISAGKPTIEIVGWKQNKKKNGKHLEISIECSILKVK